MKKKWLIFAIFLPFLTSGSSSNSWQYSTSEMDILFPSRSLFFRQQLAAIDPNQLDTWWRREKIPDPHKYLLPVLLARLSLPQIYDPKPNVELLTQLNKERPDLYHFRSIFDIRLFFLLREQLSESLETDYQKMLKSPAASQWMEQGTENHMFMQRLSGLAFADGSNFSTDYPGVFSTNEAWLRSELNKFLTVGQGEFHSSTYYGYTIAGLLNLYDYAQTPELKQLAKATLDWLATNMALRLSWGTAGGAESRGFDRKTWRSSLGAVAWVWWGENTDLKFSNRDERTALIAALSSYRPPSQLKLLAQKKIPLPFTLQASHPNYYRFQGDNQFWETFYVTPDYSLGTLLIPQRSYQVTGTINAQYATYKLVVRDPKGQENAGISLGGTYHNLMATGASPGDQYLQEKGTVLYQLRLNLQDIAAQVPLRTHLVLPSRYGTPKEYKSWFIWQVEQTWLCARPWGDKIEVVSKVSERNKDAQALAALGNQTAWITEVASLKEYPSFEALTKALDQTKIDDGFLSSIGRLEYTSLAGDRLIMTYNPTGGIAKASVNDQERILGNWDVLESPYVQQPLNSGILSVTLPNQRPWRLKATITSPEWEED